MGSEVPFHVVDVFAASPLTGNPLALVPEADALSPATLAAIAREFNQSETTFLLRPTGKTATWRLRSFTPAGVEVFGAGHNAMGAWLWLARAGVLPSGETRFVQEIGDDLLGVELTWDAEGAPIVTMEQSPPLFGAEIDAGRSAELARALGLGPGSLVSADAAQVVSTGAPHLLVPVVDRDAVDAARPDSAALLEVLRSVDAEGCYVYTESPAAGSAPDAGAAGTVAYARFFNPTAGIPEDPATGTAAGPLVARLVVAGRVPAGAVAIVEQGAALGRPSLLRVVVEGDRVRLSGSGLVVADGVLHL
ncbi:PhzF family phenazine biosynthesis protein [Herbiconiux sp. 11R-BC]|uniref:PhzF family phenazine biosynthesis protein n=1 Tax=Herbiconiux sp. 11R-BC TaxID=3111637 RepID=UPI003C0082BF